MPSADEKCRVSCPWPDCHTDGTDRGSFTGAPGKCVDFDHDGAKRRCDMYRRSLPETNPIHLR